MPSRNPQPLRQEFALAYAMQRRPTKALASRYFETIKRMLDADPAAHNDNAIGPETEVIMKWAAGVAA